MSTPDTNTSTNTSIMSASAVEGVEVRNMEGQELGEIKDVKLDLESGYIVYAVLAFEEGFLGLDKKLFPIPWKSLKRDEGSFCFFLDIPKSVLEEAPGYDEDDLSRMLDRTFINEVYGHYGYEPLYILV